MSVASKLSISFAATVAITSFATANSAGAAPPVCRPALSGQATSTGILGLGTQLAREAAIADFEDRASGAYGSRYGKFRRARFVRWDCQENAILFGEMRRDRAAVPLSEDETQLFAQ